MLSNQFAERIFALRLPSRMLHIINEQFLGIHACDIWRFPNEYLKNAIYNVKGRNCQSHYCNHSVISKSNGTRANATTTLLYWISLKKWLDLVFGTGIWTKSTIKTHSREQVQLAKRWTVNYLWLPPLQLQSMQILLSVMWIKIKKNKKKTIIAQDFINLIQCIW